MIYVGSGKMQNAQHKHDDYNELLLSGLYNQMRKILDSSGQPVFIYLDDNHKACNQRFADFLGYTSPQDWSQTLGFLEILADDEASKNAFMTAYWSAINNMNASSVQLTLRRKDASKVKATMVILPMTYEGQILSVHFIISTQ
jgi:PAS domain-containing protein